MTKIQMVMAVATRVQKDPSQVLILFLPLTYRLGCSPNRSKGGFVQLLDLVV